MNAPFPRRSHLVERAAEAARAAIVADSTIARLPRSVLAPAEILPGAGDVAALADVESQAPSPPHGNELPRITGAQLRSAGLVGEIGPAREQIALVREQVLRTLDGALSTEGRKEQLVVVTSSRCGEGKTYVALNLAASIAEGAHRPVVLVDAGRGDDSLTSRLGLGDTPGLEQLRDADDPDPVGLLHRTAIPGLSVLPHGTTSRPGMRGGFMVGALLHLAGRLPEHIIVLDTPACLESSAAGVLAVVAGQIALVVQAERTKRAEVEAALDILDACPTLQLLLNRSALQVSDRFTGPAASAGDVAIGAHST